MSVVDENIVVNLITIYDKQEICNVSEHYIDQIKQDFYLYLYKSIAAITW